MGDMLADGPETAAGGVRVSRRAADVTWITAREGWFMGRPDVLTRVAGCTK
ncbi:hypothetical protein [Mycobacteroides immunogenum]|uniref:hypothetical protein n=1 Tax=Mycobacteroides immunogenum TaxID=83262 RepID=UPI000AB8E2A3|nr:hypothetical protein [Mycobacteroides immunogenum]